MKNSVGILIWLIAGLGLLSAFTSCESGPETEETEKKVPSWVAEYPIDPDYFIGIGSSNTGDRGADMEKARLAALASLSSAISTKIEAEIVVETTDDSEGNTYERLTQRIEENVKQNLKGVEPVDSFYSKEEGYWFYFRFAKAKLDEMKETLKERVVGMTESVLAEEQTVAEKLAILWDGFKLIYESPFVGTIQAAVGDSQGALIDILQSELSRLSAALEIDAEPEELLIEQGEAPEFALAVGNSAGLQTGQFHCVLVSNGQEIAEVVTDQDGFFRGKVDLASMELGRQTCVWKVDFSDLGIDEKIVRVFTPEADLFVELQKRSVGLQAATGSGESFPGLYNSVSALFGEEMPFEITSDFDPEGTNIIFTLYFRDLPENDYGLYFTFARGVINVVRNGKSLFSYETEEFKEGGIDGNQARERAKNKLFAALEENKALFGKIKSAVTEEPK